MVAFRGNGRDAHVKWFLYNGLFAVAYLAMLPSFLLRMKRRGGYRARMGDRFGRYPADIAARLSTPQSPIWLHAVSVGEVQVAVQLMRALRERDRTVRFVFSTTSSTGWKTAERELARLAADGLGNDGDVLVYNPLDFNGCVRRALDRIHPRAVILTETEMRARYEIHLENYCKVSAIEANTLLEMAMRGVLPAVARYSGDLAKGMAHKQEAQFSDLCRIEKYLIQELGIQGGQLLDVCQSLSQALENAPAADSGIDAARYYRSEIVTRTQKAGELIGQLESLVDAKAWPYPTYADILFSV